MVQNIFFFFLSLKTFCKIFDSHLSSDRCVLGIRLDVRRIIRKITPCLSPFCGTVLRRKGRRHYSSATTTRLPRKDLNGRVSCEVELFLHGGCFLRTVFLSRTWVRKPGLWIAFLYGPISFLKLWWCSSRGWFRVYVPRGTLLLGYKKWFSCRTLYFSQSPPTRQVSIFLVDASVPTQTWTKFHWSHPPSVEKTLLSL